MKYRYMLMRLQLLIESPKFISILISILFTIYKISIDPGMLCDDSVVTLYELKTRLTVEIGHYNIAAVKVEKYIELEEQLKEISRPNFRNFSQEEFYNDKINSWVSRKVKSLHNARVLEHAIKKIQPDFKSVTTGVSYPRVR